MKNFVQNVHFAIPYLTLNKKGVAIIYGAFFRMRFINGLQYRAAAYAGITTQFAWGFMTILMFNAFYRSGAENFPMTFEQLSSYIWLQQAFLALFMAWFFENEIFDSITDGNVAYEMCRPVSIYSMWFVRSLASRASKAVLRCMPIIVVAAFLPKPFGMSLPASFATFLLFLVSMLLGFLTIVSFNMLIYISAFYTISPMGIKILSMSLVEFLSGGLIPLPFLPDGLRKIFELLPFASMQNTPFLIYNGNLKGDEVYFKIFLQLFWFGTLYGLGRILMKKALKKVIVQGG